MSNPETKLVGHGAIESDVTVDSNRDQGSQGQERTNSVRPHQLPYSRLQIVSEIHWFIFILSKPNDFDEKSEQQGADEHEFVMVPCIFEFDTHLYLIDDLFVFVGNQTVLLVFLQGKLKDLKVGIYVRALARRLRFVVVCTRAHGFLIVSNMCRAFHNLLVEFKR